ENILERALALSSGDELTPQDMALHRILPEETEAAETAALQPGRAGASPVQGPLPAYLDAVERDAILEALGKTGYNRTGAAKLLGITFRQLRYRMQRLGIKDETKS